MHQADHTGRPDIQNSLYPSLRSYLSVISRAWLKEPLIFRLYAEQYVQTLGIFRNCNLSSPLYRFAWTGYRCRREMRALIKTVDDAICTNDRQLANMNIGGVLAGGGGLSCKLQAEVGALDPIGEGESAFINRTSFKILVVVK